MFIGIDEFWCGDGQVLVFSPNTSLLFRGLEMFNVDARGDTRMAVCTVRSVDMVSTASKA